MDKKQNCPTLFPYFQSNIDQNDPFESTLSSMVSSPTTVASNGGELISGDGMMIRELIGRLGSICDSGEISPQSCIVNNTTSTKTSCYNTPLNSPPKLDLSSLVMKGYNGNFTSNLSPLNAADPGFVERAAKFSCFGMKVSSRSVDEKLESGKLSSNNCIKVGVVGGSDVQIGENLGGNLIMNGDSREGSSVSQHNGEFKPQIGANSRKRKPLPKAKAKDEMVEAENEESNVKRRKQEEEEGKKKQSGEDSSNNNKEKEKTNNNNQKEKTTKEEPPKDYIHVRARRGQATDSHSLAERVRREKISERMRFLQDLVPGCNKVTGKATVLDEIINYVQSLQRQVEFLSMKLATVNPRMEFNLETLLTKDMFQSGGAGIPQTMYPLDQSSMQTFPYNFQSSQPLPSSLSNCLSNGSENPFSSNLLDAAGIRRNPSIQLPSLDAFGDSLSQVPTIWEDDLQSLVQNQIGIAHNQIQSVQPDNLPHVQMKVEL